VTANETIQYLRTKKRLLKKHSLSVNDIEETISLFKTNRDDHSLQYKKMTCKKDKNRYSIRVLNTQYRILMTVVGDEAFLVCVCNHGDYDRLNKDC